MVAKAEEGIRMGELMVPAYLEQGVPFSVAIPLQAACENPYDPDCLRVEARIRPPNAKELVLPCYYVEPYEVIQGETAFTRTGAAGHPQAASSQARGSLEWNPTGRSEWRLSFRPLEAGLHRLRLYAETRTHWAASPELCLAVKPATRSYRGVVRQSPRDPLYLEYQSGDSFFPIGLNICWGEMADLAGYLEKMAASGGNFVRFWMCPWNFDLEWKEVGRYDQKAAAKMDFIFEQCERLGLQVMLCLDYHGALKWKESWQKNPYSRARGGPCAVPADFFSDSRARKIYQNRLRYLVARYASSPALCIWELFNEVDLTDPYPFHERAILRWHETMASYLQRHDPYRHLVTTSLSGPVEYESQLWSSNVLDVVQAHHYFRARPATLEVRRLMDRLAIFRRPRLVAEFGLDEELAKRFDPEGASFRQALWAGSLLGAAGSPMPWWWDSAIDRFGLYRHLTTLQQFLATIDFPGENFRPLKNCTLEVAPQASKTRGNVSIQPEHSAFEPAPFNRPQRFVVRQDGQLQGETVPAEIIHGLTAHPKLHNPQTFEVDFAADGNFCVIINEVSNWAPTELKIYVDSSLALHQRFPDDDPGRGVQYRYNGVYPAPVKAGKHRVTVDNEGGDWIRVAYYLKNYLHAGPRPPEIFGLVGQNNVLVWLWNRESIYYAKSYGLEPQPIEGVTLHMKELSYGRWQASIWQPASGHLLSSRTVEGNRARIELPPIVEDLAVKLVRVPN